MMTKAYQINQRSLPKRLAVALGLAFSAAAAFAQDSGPLIDLLVRKGIVTDQEAEELRVELLKDFTANSSAGKLNLSSSLSEFKLSGDLRMRYEANSQTPELATGGAPVSNETSRQRLRFRFNGDFLLQKGWNAGFALETTQASDSGNQTFTGGADDYGIFLTRAYIGWQPNLNWSFAIGKQKNPFLTTDLRWDSDINPQGLFQGYKMMLGVKDTLEFRAMQHFMFENNEQLIGPAGRDAWMFEQQAVYTRWFAPENLSNVIFAVGYSAYSQSTMTGLLNSAALAGSTRAQNYGTLTGEVNLARINGDGTALKFYWDGSYNFTGDTRAYRVYTLNRSVFDAGKSAWLVGLGYSYGTGKIQGDYSARLDYREVGVSAIDPNINDSDWGFGKTNQKGLKLALAYNVNDFTNFNVTYFDTKIIDEKMTFALGNLNRSHELLVDLVLKF
jgi:polyhydroxyalkanoate synthesis regulator phasin